INQPGWGGLQGVYYDSDGDVKTAKALAVNVGVSQQFTDTVSASIIYGYGQEKFDDYLGGGDDTKYKSQSASANLFYSPVDPLTFAVGYKYVKAKYTGGIEREGDANRIVFS